jgi:hypothetical protein
MPTKTLTARPCNESWAARRTLRYLAAAKTASQRREGAPIVSHADQRGSSPTAS